MDGWIDGCMVGWIHRWIGGRLMVSDRRWDGELADDG